MSCVFFINYMCSIADNLVATDISENATGDFVRKRTL